MRGGLIGRRTAAMGVAMEVELAPPELAPKQTRRSERHDDEGDDGLPVPVHAANIVGWPVVANGKVRPVWWGEAPDEPLRVWLLSAHPAREDARPTQ